MVHTTNVCSESVVEQAALAWMESLGYVVKHGPDIAHDAPRAERRDPNYGDVVLGDRLRQAVVRLNRDLPPEGGHLPQTHPTRKAHAGGR